MINQPRSRAITSCVSSALMNMMMDSCPILMRSHTVPGLGLHLEQRLYNWEEPVLNIHRQHSSLWWHCFLMSYQQQGQRLYDSENINKVLDGIEYGILAINIGKQIYIVIQVDISTTVQELCCVMYIKYAEKLFLTDSELSHNVKLSSSECNNMILIYPDGSTVVFDHCLKTRDRWVSYMDISTMVDHTIKQYINMHRQTVASFILGWPILISARGEWGNEAPSPAKFGWSKLSTWKQGRQLQPKPM